MSAIHDVQAMVSRIPATLAGLLDVPEADLQMQTELGWGKADAVVTVFGRVFAVEVSCAASAGPIASTVARASAAPEALPQGSIPLVAVPFMGASGKQACERAGISWFDFSGNARIVVPGIRVTCMGR